MSVLGLNFFSLYFDLRLKKQECTGGDVFDPELKRCVPYGEASCNDGNLKFSLHHSGQTKMIV